MQISEVLAIHNSSSANQSHIDILGDGFLMNANPIYRNMKVFALQIGCQYLEAWPQYLLLPFHELNNIVATKNIPYVPNGRMLQEVENKRPHVFNTEDMSMPESYHLHEAAHVIAEHLFEEVSLTSRQEKILKTILCESFANTVDAVACVPATTEMHQFFLKHNCYMHPLKKNMDVMTRLTTRLGFRCNFMLTLFAYVHSNFLKETLSRDTIKELVTRYSPNTELTEKLLRDCETVGRIGEALDPRFRVQTTEIYFKLEGYEGEIFDLLNFSCMQVFAVNEDFRRVAEAMAEVVSRDLAQ